METASLDYLRAYASAMIEIAAEGTARPAPCSFWVGPLACDASPVGRGPIMLAHIALERLERARQTLN
jgi:hypothetical protein